MGESRSGRDFVWDYPASSIYRSGAGADPVTQHRKLHHVLEWFGVAVDETPMPRHPAYPHTRNAFR
jgi:hypothetical protein